MPRKIADRLPPRGFTRLMVRAPNWLYRLGLGWLLGQRFLLLNHIGRKSGLQRQATLEVVDHEEVTDTYFVASGLGKRSDWYQNLAKTPDVSIQVGRRKMAVTAALLGSEESGQAMVDYARRHPSAARKIARACGYQVDGTDEDYFVLGRDIIPFVALRPRRAPAG